MKRILKLVALLVATFIAYTFLNVTSDTTTNTQITTASTGLRSHR